jgi:predicted ferric reductase
MTSAKPIATAAEMNLESRSDMFKWSIEIVIAILYMFVSKMPFYYTNIKLIYRLIECLFCFLVVCSFVSDPVVFGRQVVLSCVSDDVTSCVRNH